VSQVNTVRATRLRRACAVHADASDWCADMPPVLRVGDVGMPELRTTGPVRAPGRSNGFKQPHDGFVLVLGNPGGPFTQRRYRVRHRFVVGFGADPSAANQSDSTFR
jgi:hypothetical protein